MKKTSYFFALTFAFLMLGCSAANEIISGKMEFSELDYGYEIHHAQLANIKLAYIDEGQSEIPLILIHGLGTNAKGWIRNIPELSKLHRVIAIDLPGYGKSDKGYYQYSMEFYADVLIHLMNELQIEKAIPVGHSMGGQIAMTAGLKYPDRIQKLVLIAPAGFERFDIGEADWMKKAMSVDFIKKTTMDAIDKNLRSNFYHYPAEAKFMIDERVKLRYAKDFDDYVYAVHRNVYAMLDGPVWMKLSQIQQPTLILFGENDLLIPNRYLHAGFTKNIAKIGDEEIPNSTLQMIPKCGHFVQFEKPEQTNGAILKFME